MSDLAPKLAVKPVSLVSLPRTTSVVDAFPLDGTLNVADVPKPEMSVFDSVIAPVLPATLVTALLEGEAQTPSPLRNVSAPAVPDAFIALIGTVNAPNLPDAIVPLVRFDALVWSTFCTLPNLTAALSSVAQVLSPL